VWRKREICAARGGCESGRETRQTVAYCRSKNFGDMKVALNVVQGLRAPLAGGVLRKAIFAENRPLERQLIDTILIS
jgi:hypothetical protein